MSLPEHLFTGFYDKDGYKIYLGDKLRRYITSSISSSFVVSFDVQNQAYCLIPFGKDVKQLPYRIYPVLGNLDAEEGKMHVVGNVIFAETATLQSEVKISVTNKGDGFPFGSMAKVLEVSEWEVLLKSKINQEERSFNYGEFINQRI
ncbi:hypothetical protein [Sphingobacterium hungaricum]|uniref:Uncharacterized protein n=1 Tax=Sphingobacterium hungaricum TaxID=2082723 RepID=A0A928UXI9_9SPHI|nr:hypothetical protein [Sphingobacterium hungaricum]MBE8713180.1 hypothetical protein [Sphingobacterium hungaricum]